MKRNLQFIIVICLVWACVYSCKEPDDDPVNDNPDPFSSYTRITPDISFRHASYTDYYSFVNYFIDDIIYIIATGERYNIEMAEFSTDAMVHTGTSVYESEIKLDITTAIPVGSDVFLAAGGIFNETPDPYSNPFYKSVDLFSEIRILDWNGRSNSFEGVTMYDNENAIGALFLARDETGTIGGKYPLYQYSMVYTEHYDDSAQISPFPIDSCFIDYYDKPSVYTERFVGVKVDALTIDTGIVTHMFYLENAGGNLVEYNLGNLSPGKLVPDNIYYENVNPLKIYRWSFNGPKSIMTLDKYSHTGQLEYSRDIMLFENYGLIETDVVCKVEKSADHNYCLVYGYFKHKYIYPDSADFKGNFLIRIDDEGNETDRVIWDEDITGQYAGEQHIQDIGDGRFVFLYSFDFSTDNDYFIFERIDL